MRIHANHPFFVWREAAKIHLGFSGVFEDAYLFPAVYADTYVIAAAGEQGPPQGQNVALHLVGLDFDNRLFAAGLDLNGQTPERKVAVRDPGLDLDIAFFRFGCIVQVIFRRLEAA